MKDTIWIKKGRFTPLAILLMLALPLATSVICLCFGRMNVPVGEVLTALRTALTGGSAANVQNYSIVINLRLPRILRAIIVGVFQSTCHAGHFGRDQRHLCGCNSGHHSVVQHSGNTAHCAGVRPCVCLLYPENCRQE